MNEVVETIYGKHSKFEIIRNSGTWSTRFYIRKDGKAYKGHYASLATAVAAAKKAAE